MTPRVTAQSPRNLARETEPSTIDQEGIIALLGEISARFIHFPTQSFDRLVTQSLRQLAEALGLQGASLVFINDVECIASHEFPGLGSSEMPVELSVASIAKLKSGEPVVVHEGGGIHSR